MFISPSYTEQTYKDLADVYSNSQYRKKTNPGIIPDEAVFSYAAGALAHGMDPILINSEHTPLGKYFLAGSILWLQNDKFPILVFGFFTLVAVWLLGRLLFKDPYLACIPVALLTCDVLFRNQFVTVPLLDIIQLPFVLFTLIAFIIEYESGKHRYFWTSLLIGLVMATKHPTLGILLGLVCLVVLYTLSKSLKQIFNFCMWMSVGAGLFIVTYTRTFLSGYSFFEFIGFQKWILLYQKSKLIYPFSSWKLLLFNQWQTWWDNDRVIQAVDWSWMWPASTLLVIGLTIVWILRKIYIPTSGVVAIVWWWALMAFLSLGVVSSRFFLPLLPVSYCLSIYVIFLLAKHFSKIFQIR